MARKRYQRGGLRLRGAGDRRKWVLQIREDVQDGPLIRRHLKTLFVGWFADLPTKPLARRRADAVLAAEGINDLDYRPRSGVRLEEMVQTFNAMGMTSWKAGTQDKAEEHLRLHILPTLGRLPLEDIGNLEVQKAIATWAERLGEKSIRNVLGTFGAVFQAARDWGHASQRWHLDGLRIPKDHTPDREMAYTVDEARRILAAAVNPWRSIYALGCLAGLRGEEILGLHVNDLDLQAGSMRIRWTVGPKRVMQDTKSKAGTRTVPIIPALQVMLEDHLRRTWKPNEAGLLFAVKTGRPMSHSKVLEKHLYPLQVKLGIPQRGLHGFRHTAISLLVEEGVPLPLVQAIVGHSHVETTLEIYSHVLRAEHREALAKLGNILMPDDANANFNRLIQ